MEIAFLLLIVLSGPWMGDQMLLEVVLESQLEALLLLDPKKYPNIPGQ